MEEVKRAVGYIRVSTAEQSLKGLSIETQIAEIKEYAAYHKMKLEEIYIDRGITARKSLDKRIEFMRMMHDVEAGKIDHIIVLRLDRFFRNVYDYHRMMNEYLTPNNCDWSAVKESYTTETTNGRLMINLRLSIAEQECDTDSDRIKDVLDHRAREGFAISGAQPFGYKIVDKRVVVDEEKREIVKDIFNHMEETSSIRGTMKYVNAKYQKTFFYATFHKMLSNPMFYGTYRDNPNYCEGIITKKQFDNVQRLMKINVRERKNKYVYLFSGLLVCAHCGRKMAGNVNAGKKNNKYTYFYYRCNKGVLDVMCDNKISINSAGLEQYLIENVEDLIKKYILEVETKEKAKKPKKSNRAAIEKKIERLNILYVDGFIDIEKYREDYAAYQKQIIDTSETQKKDLTAAKKFLEANYFSGPYFTFSDVEKQAIWRSVIKEIRVSGNVVTDIEFL